MLNSSSSIVFPTLQSSPKKLQYDGQQQQQQQHVVEEYDDDERTSFSPSSSAASSSYSPSNDEPSVVANDQSYHRRDEIVVNVPTKQPKMPTFNMSKLMCCCCCYLLCVKKDSVYCTAQIVSSVFLLYLLVTWLYKLSLGSSTRW